MSSVVNKSKNKFLPKVKARARVNTTPTSATHEPNVSIQQSQILPRASSTKARLAQEPNAAPLDQTTDLEVSVRYSNGIPVLLGAHVETKPSSKPEFQKVSTTYDILSETTLDRSSEIDAIKPPPGQIFMPPPKADERLKFLPPTEQQQELQLQLETIQSSLLQGSASDTTNIGNSASKKRRAPLESILQDTTSLKRSKIDSNAISKKPPSTDNYQNDRAQSCSIIESSDVHANDCESQYSDASKPKAKAKIATIKHSKISQRRKREESPADGEKRQIEEHIVKMKDLVRDPLIGRKSKRFVELLQLKQNERARKSEGPMSAMGEAQISQSETYEERLNRLTRASGVAQDMSAPQLRVVDGKIVLDEESLKIDRHRRDAIEEETMEIVEEDQNTRLVNSASWSKKERGEKWDQASTERYYEALSMFGTDFEMIAKLFPGRSRRMVKNKFNCEERKNPQKITRALRTRISIDMNEYSKISDIQFGEVQDLTEEFQRLRDEHNAEDEKSKLQAIETEKERQEKANAAMYAEGYKTTEPQKARRKKGKNIDCVNEEVLSMSIEEYENQRLRAVEDD